MSGNTVSLSTTAVAFAGVSLVAIVAPFELTQPLLRLPRQSVSSLETAVLLALGSWGVALAVTRAMPRWHTPLTWPWVLLLAALAMASIAAPAARTNALHMTGRVTAAFAFYLLTVNAVTTRARLRTVLDLIVVSGIAVSALVCLEYARVPWVLDALKIFRPGVSVVGAQLRAGGPLQYPTIASMYLEVVFAFGLGLLLTALDAAQPVSVVLLSVTLVLVAEAITLTFTRAGLITMASSLTLIGAMRYRRRGPDAGVALIGALAVIIGVLFVTSRSAESVWLRLTSEGQESWYRARIAAPPPLTMAAGLRAIVPLDVTNTGRLVWDSHGESPLLFSYHWLPVDADDFVTFEGVRTAFSEPVLPGATISISAFVKAPSQPGRYRLEWDVVQEGQLWFSTEPGARRTMSAVTVTGAPFNGPDDSPMPPPRPTLRPGRFVLWRAAARMLAAHPLLGVGPDNFRLTYGDYANLHPADSRLHSNNMYVEMFAGSGLVGGGAFLWLLWRAGAVFARNLGPGAGLAAAGLAIAIHGMVDSFLSFGPTYLLFGLTLGLAVASLGISPRDGNAYSV